VQDRIRPTHLHVASRAASEADRHRPPTSPYRRAAGKPPAAPGA
jgi:hypothetical protein